MTTESGGPSVSRKARALVIEDDVSFNDILRFVLNESGILVDAFDSGRRALEYLSQREPPDVVLLDLNLRPDMSGAAFIRAFKAGSARPPPIVLMSGESSAAAAAATLEADGFLPKPFALEELMEVVNRFVPGSFSRC